MGKVITRETQKSALALGTEERGNECASTAVVEAPQPKSQIAFSLAHFTYYRELESKFSAGWSSPDQRVSERALISSEAVFVARTLIERLGEKIQDVCDFQMDQVILSFQICLVAYKEIR
jgi:hypothetical protein